MELCHGEYEVKEMFFAESVDPSFDVGVALNILPRPSDLIFIWNLC